MRNGSLHACHHMFHLTTPGSCGVVLTFKSMLAIYSGLILSFPNLHIIFLGTAMPIYSRLHLSVATHQNLAFVPKFLD